MEILPRPFGEVLGAATVGLGRVWKALIWPVLTVSAATSLVTIVIFAMTGAGEFFELLVNNSDALLEMTEAELRQAAEPFLLAVGLATLALILLTAFTHVIAGRAVAIDVAGSVPKASAVSLQAISRLGRTIWALVVLGSMVMSLFLISAIFNGHPFVLSAVVVTLLWGLVAVSMVFSVIAVENRSAIESLSRSWRLTQDRWWSTVGFLFVVSVIGIVAVQLIQFLAFPLALVGAGGPAVLAAAVLGVLAQGVIMAAIGVAYAHWYIDLRSRKEPVVSSDLG